jgi:GT2 family glycosyltransferase
MNSTTGPLVSVVIPSYNCAPYLEEALASVQRQTLGDHEIIVVDDGSTDGTVEILRRRESPWLRFLTQHRRGPAAARNRGIQAATGRYIAFLDADDVWDPEKLAIQVAFMEAEQEVGMSFTDWAWLGSEQGTPSAFETARAVLERLESRASTGPARVLCGRRLLCHYLLHGPIPCWTSAVIVRRQTLERTGLFDERLRGDEDTHLWLRLLTAAPVGYVDRVLAWRRERSASVTTSRTEAEQHRISAEAVATLEEQLVLTPAERAAVRTRVSQLRAAAGYCRMNAGDLVGARSDFRAALLTRPSLRTAAYWLATTLPVPLFACLREAKRRGIIALLGVTPEPGIQSSEHAHRNR